MVGLKKGLFLFALATLVISTACSSGTYLTPFTPSATTPVVSTFQPPSIPANFTTYTDKAGLFSISYPSKWALALSLIEGNTIFIAGQPYQDGYNPNVSILLLPYKQSLLLPYQPTDSAWKLEDFVEVRVQEAIKFVSKEYYEYSRTKIVVGGSEAIVVDSESTTLGMKIRGLKMYVRNGTQVWMVICGVLPATNFSDYEADFHAIVNSLRILK